MSRSGLIRQLINPTQKRLQASLQELDPIDLNLSFDISIPEDEKITKLEEKGYVTKNFLKRINGAFTILRNQNEEWSLLLRALPEDQLAAETIVYEEWTKPSDNFIEIMMQGLEAVDMLESKLAEIQDLIVKTQTKINNVQHKETLAPSLLPTSIQSRVEHQAHTYLPKLQLPIYYGDPLKWIEYWDAFSASVHSQEIPAVQKFNYLLSTLKGSAYKSIEGIAITSANYKEAIEILKNRFGDINVIKRTLYSELRSIASSTHKTADLRRTIENIDRISRQLKSLGEDLNQPTLVMLILEKLPGIVLIELGKLKEPSQLWNFEDLSKHLHNIVAVKEEANQIVQNSSYENKESQVLQRNDRQRLNHFKGTTEAFSSFVQPRKQSQQQASAFTTKAKLYPCAFCHKDHLNDQCPTYSNLAERKQRVQEQNLCFRCLRPGHAAKDCYFTRPCAYCSNNHNRALCGKKLESNSNATTSKFAVSSGHIKGHYFEKNGERNRPQNVTPVQNQSNANGQQQFCTQKPFNVVNMTATSRDHSNISKTITMDSVALLTAKIKVLNHKQASQKPIAVNVFFDSGSQRSYITNDLKEQLGLQSMCNEILSVNTFASKNPQKIKTSLIQIGIELQDESIKIIQANSVPILTERIRHVPLQLEDFQFLSELIPVGRIENSAETMRPQVLIGMDYFWEFFDQTNVIKLPSGLFLVNSKIGPMFSGKQNATEDVLSNNCTSITTANIGLVDKNEKEQSFTQINNLESFWELEAIGIKDQPQLIDDDIALKKFNDTVLMKDGRYQIQWPWRADDIDLKDNFGIAHGRLKSAMHKFKQDPELLQKYSAIMEDQLQKGIIEKVDDTERNNFKKHYLPHHAVVTPQKHTTKIRIVFDASAKANKTANSLNDCLYRGPILMPDLCGLLIRFRMKPVVLIADIEKAFLQIGIQDLDKDVTRFLWLKDPTKPEIENNIQIYRFCRVTFGVVSSPFLLNATVQYHLGQSESEISTELAKNLYVDNLLIGAMSNEEALNIYKESKEIFQEAGMNLREWSSNSVHVKSKLPEEDLLKQEEVKVLGIPWDTISDTLKLQLSVSGKQRDFPEKMTKRLVLQKIASTFDPLGYLSPLIFASKVFLQKLWQTKLTWDENLPENLAEEWQAIEADWRKRNTFYIARAVPHSFENTTHTLIAFADASKQAYATTIYLQTTDPLGTKSTNLVFSKNRLAPLKETTLPRLELLGAVIGCHALKFVEEQIGIPIQHKFLFTDSECVLHWLKSSKPLSVFVSNRLKVLRQMTNTTFRYIASASNPADIATKKTSTENFENCDLWWRGPNWINTLPETWPLGNLPEINPETMEYSIQESSNTTTEGIYHSHIHTANKDESSETHGLVNLDRISSFPKATRIVSYVLRYIKLKIGNKICNKQQRPGYMPLLNMFKLREFFTNIQDEGPIRAQEMKVAEEILIVESQKRHYLGFFDKTKKDKEHNLLENQLGVNVGTNNILHCCGRLENANVAEIAKYPILLPSKDRLTELIVLEIHKNVMHFGVSHTLSEIRQKYWIPKGRTSVKSILKKCYICRHYTVGPYKLPKFPPLPKERVEKARPFQYIGIDYMGPLIVKDKNEEPTKVWVCLFTCLATRAIHLEHVCDLTAIGFLNCIRRLKKKEES